MNIKREIQRELEEAQWVEYYEGNGALGRITVSQGPPGSAPTPDQPTSTWREHLRRQGSHGGEHLSYVVAKLLRRPVMVMAGETASVGLRAGAPYRRAPPWCPLRSGAPGGPFCVPSRASRPADPCPVGNPHLGPPPMILHGGHPLESRQQRGPRRTGRAAFPCPGNAGSFPPPRRR